MNIFATDPSPIKSAQYLDDKRVVKMVIESAQMLCHVLGYVGDESYGLSPSHWNHPVIRWLEQDRSHVAWLCAHAAALMDEYARRYGKLHDAEKLRQVFSVVCEARPGRFINCAANRKMGISHAGLPDVHLAYQLYLNDRWDTDVRTPTWYGIPLR